MEGVRRVLGSDHRLDVAVARVEATEVVEDLARFGDRMADVLQLVGEALELGAVVVDGHVALLHGAELGLEEDGALQLVVMEQTLDGVPEEEGVLAIAPNHVEDAAGDRGEDPVDDARVHHAPLAVAIRRGSGGADMAAEAKLAERGVEEEAPLAVVSFVHVEDDRNMVVDGDALNHRRGGWGDGRSIVVIRGGGDAGVAWRERHGSGRRKEDQS